MECFSKENKDVMSFIENSLYEKKIVTATNCFFYNTMQIVHNKFSKQDSLHLHRIDVVV